MVVLRQISDIASLQGPVHLAIGVFDGVHRGHQAVIGSAVSQAKRDAGVPVLVTFEPHPVQVLAPDRAPQLLTSHEQKLALVEALGVGHALVIPFGRAFAQLTGEAFVDLMLEHANDLRSVHVGEGWCFGHQRSGTVPMLQELGAEKGFAVHAVPHVAWKGETVNSTKIRQALEQGALSRVAALLGRAYGIMGTVEAGQKLARHLGFPTANL